MKKSFAILLLLVISAIAHGEEGVQKPLDIRFGEAVEVTALAEDVVSYRVTVWLKGNDASFSDLDLSEVEVWVRDRWCTMRRCPDLFIEWGEDARVALEATPQGRRWVLYFMEPFLGCGIERYIVHRKVRKEVLGFITEGFSPERGDTLIIASWEGSKISIPLTAEISDREIAISEFLRVRGDSTLPASVYHIDNVRPALMNLADLLGDDESGRKTEIIPLLIDFPLGAEEAEELRSVSERLHLANATIHTFDLFRKLKRPLLAVGLGPLARGSGGMPWKRGTTIAERAQEIVSRSRPLYISMPKGERVSGVRVDLRDARFSVSAPSAVAKLTPEIRQERSMARMQMPQWGLDIGLETLLWPMGPRFEHALLTIRITVAEELPHHVNELIVDMALDKAEFLLESGERSQKYWMRISHKNLTELREFGETTLVFDVGVHKRAFRSRRRAPTVRVIVRTPDLKAGASEQVTWKHIPWKLVSLAKRNGDIFISPVLSDKSRNPVFVGGYYCGDSSPTVGISSAPQSTAARFPAELFGELRGKCGFYTARLNLQPGVYSLSVDDREDLHFIVEDQAPSISSTAHTPEISREHAP